MNSTATFSPSIVSEIQLSYQPVIKPSLRPKITRSSEAYEILLNSWDSDLLYLQEQFKVMLLNRGSRVLVIVELSAGGITGTVADPKLIFAAALKACATSIILAHNHPSGQLAPSVADISLTRKVAAGGQLLEICVSDHMIITGEGYYSFADHGTL